MVDNRRAEVIEYAREHGFLTGSLAFGVSSAGSDEDWAVNVEEFKKHFGEQGLAQARECADAHGGDAYKDNATGLVDVLTFRVAPLKVDVLLLSPLGLARYERATELTTALAQGSLEAKALLRDKVTRIKVFEFFKAL